MSSGISIKRIEWREDLAVNLAQRLSVEATEAGGELMLDAAESRVPYRTGALRDSRAINVTENGIAVGYRAWYARVLNAHPEWDYQDGRSGRWLEETIEAEHDTIGRALAETFRHGWPG